MDTVNTVPYTPEAVAILKQSGHNNAEIARLTGVNPSSITRLLQRIEDNKELITKTSAQLADILTHNIGLASEAITKTLVWYNEMSETDYNGLPWSAKKAMGDLANNIMGTSFDKRQLELGRSTSNIGVNEVRSLSRQDLQDLARVVLVERESKLFKDDSIDAGQSYKKT